MGVVPYIVVRGTSCYGIWYLVYWWVPPYVLVEVPHFMEGGTLRSGEL